MMLTNNDKLDLRNKINSCNSVGQVLKLIQKEFDVDNCQLGFVTKPIFVEGIIKAINLTNPKKN